MLRATANQLLPTTITGSLPRPSWYTENMGLKSFLQAMVETRFHEQREDALSVYFGEQLSAGLAEPNLTLLNIAKDNAYTLQRS